MLLSDSGLQEIGLEKQLGGVQEHAGAVTSSGSKVSGLLCAVLCCAVQRGGRGRLTGSLGFLPRSTLSWTPCVWTWPFCYLNVKGIYQGPPYPSGSARGHSGASLWPSPLASGGSAAGVPVLRSAQTLEPGRMSPSAACSYGSWLQKCKQGRRETSFPVNH